jgi:hypothetical protein
MTKAERDNSEPDKGERGNSEPDKGERGNSEPDRGERGIVLLHERTDFECASSAEDQKLYPER